MKVRPAALSLSLDGTLIGRDHGNAAGSAGTGALTLGGVHACVGQVEQIGRHRAVLGVGGPAK